MLLKPLVFKQFDVSWSESVLFGSEHRPHETRSDQRRATHTIVHSDAPIRQALTGRAQDVRGRTFNGRANFCRCCRSISATGLNVVDVVEPGHIVSTGRAAITL